MINNSVRARFVARTPGGGGYGNPLERDPKAVLRDVINGLVSKESAKQDYGVVIDQGVEDVDWEATKNLRATVSLNQSSSKEDKS